MAEIAVFQLSEVAQILGTTKSTVKNWTIGRPLKIEPSIRAAHGTGSSNLYSMGDLLLMALATQLNRDGFTTETIRKVLRAKEIQHKPELIGNGYSTLVISSPGGHLEAKFLAAQHSIGIVTGVHEALRAGVTGRYVLDLKALAQWIDQQIQKLKKANTEMK